MAVTDCNGSSTALGFLHCRGLREHLIDVREPEQFHNARAYSRDNHPSAVILAVHKVVHDQVDAGRVPIRYAAQVQDAAIFSGILTECCLQIK